MVPAPRVRGTGIKAFDLQHRVILITGAAGLLGEQHARAIAEVHGIPVLADVREDAARALVERLQVEYGVPALGIGLDVTSLHSCREALACILREYGRVDGLVNNAARNPKVEKSGMGTTRFETFPLEEWHRDLEVGLTGAFLCSQVFGSHFAQNGGGVIVNIASDLGIIAPDQRIYRKPGLSNDEQPTKPVTYSVVKGGLIALTRYLATYFAESNVRVNALSPGGVFVDQPAEFVEKLSQLIPLGRMASREEYRAALVFLCSDASSYMTGSNLVVDGGRTCW